MNQEIAVRNATFEDVESILKVARSTIGVPDWQEAVYRDIIAGTENAHQQAGGDVRRKMVVASMNVGVGVGVGGFAVASLLADVAEVESLAVATDYRRNGAALAMMEALDRWARGLGVLTWRLEARQSNVAALALYSRLGFCETGRRRNYYHGPTEDAVQMERRL